MGANLGDKPRFCFYLGEKVGRGLWEQRGVTHRSSLCLPTAAPAIYKTTSRMYYLAREKRDYCANQIDTMGKWQCSHPTNSIVISHLQRKLFRRRISCLSFARASKESTFCYLILEYKTPKIIRLFAFQQVGLQTVLKDFTRV